MYSAANSRLSIAASIRMCAICARRLDCLKTEPSESKASAASDISTLSQAFAKDKCKVSSSKSFWGFCVVVVLVGTSLEASSIMANYYETRWQNVLHSVMPMEAEKCARMYETSGKQTVQDYLDELQRQYSVRFYFFDENGNPLLDRGAPELILKMAKAKEALIRSAEQNLSAVNPRQGIAMRLVQGPTGRRYILAFQQSPTLIMPVSEAVGTHPYLRLL